MQTTTPINILFVSPNSREMSKAVKALEYTGYQVRSSSFGKEAFEDLQNTGLPNLAIVDADETTDASGLMFCNMLRSVSDFPILFFAGTADTKSIFDMMNPMFDDFMRKPVDTNELTMRTNRMVARYYQNAEAPANSHQLNTTLSINYIQRSVSDGMQNLILSDKETKLLFILHQNSGNLVSSDVLKERLWPNETNPSKATTSLGVAVLRLRRKLDKSFECADLIKSKYKYGYWLDATT